MSGWQQIELDGKVADLFEPVAPRDDVAIIFLHDFDAATLRDNATFTAEFERRGLRVIAPIGDRCWWTTVPCPDFDAAISPLDYVRASVVPLIGRRWNAAPPRIALLGIGMGGQGVLQMAYRWPREFPVSSAIAPAVDFHSWHGYGLSLDKMFPSLREVARQQTATLHIHPLNWPKHQFFCCDPQDEYWFEGSERLAMKLSSMGIAHERDLTTSAGGHTWPYFERMAPTTIDFITRSLVGQASA